MVKISTTNTKAEILKAYEEQVKLLKERQLENTALRQQVEEKQTLLATASTIAKTGAATNIVQVRKTLDEQLGKLETALNEEQKKFELLQDAVKVQELEIKNLYEIKAEAESLEALTITQRDTRDKLERQMSERRQQLDDNIIEAKKKWDREKEEYQYDLKLKRRNEQGKYDENKEILEKEMADRKADFEKTIAEREKAVSEQEEELKRLRKDVDAFEGRLQKAITEAEKSLADLLNKDFEYKQKLEVKDLEAELKLRDQMIHSLQGKIKEQQELISSLSTKTDSATQQVKDIAMKAIEKSGIVTVPSERRRDRDEQSGD